MENLKNQNLESISGGSDVIDASIEVSCKVSHGKDTNSEKDAINIANECVNRGFPNDKKVRLVGLLTSIISNMPLFLPCDVTVSFDVNGGKVGFLNIRSGNENIVLAGNQV